MIQLFETKLTGVASANAQQAKAATPNVAFAEFIAVSADAPSSAPFVGIEKQANGYKHAAQNILQTQGWWNASEAKPTTIKLGPNVETAMPFVSLSGQDTGVGLGLAKADIAPAELPEVPLHTDFDGQVSAAVTPQVSMPVVEANNPQPLPANTEPAPDSAGKGPAGIQPILPDVQSRPLALASPTGAQMIAPTLPATIQYSQGTEQSASTRSDLPKAVNQDPVGLPFASPEKTNVVPTWEPLGRRLQESSDKTPNAQLPNPLTEWKPIPTGVVRAAAADLGQRDAVLAKDVPLPAPAVGTTPKTVDTGRFAVESAPLNAASTAPAQDAKTTPPTAREVQTPTVPAPATALPGAEKIPPVAQQFPAAEQIAREQPAAERGPRAGVPERPTPVAQIAVSQMPAAVPKAVNQRGVDSQSAHASPPAPSAPASLRIDQPLPTPAIPAAVPVKALAMTPITASSLGSTGADGSLENPTLAPGQFLTAATPMAHGQQSIGNLQDHAPRIIQMIAEAARAMPNRPVELTLSPEELGRVKMTLHGAEASMNVVIAVERTETLELLRRNIDMLAQDFRQLGYRDVAFSFAGQGGQPQHSSTQSPEAGKHSEGNSGEATAQQGPGRAPHRLNLSGDGHMDLRV